jgi:hypothetical protein
MPFYVAKYRNSVAVISAEDRMDAFEHVLNTCYVEADELVVEEIDLEHNSTSAAWLVNPPSRDGVFSR